MKALTIVLCSIFISNFLHSQDNTNLKANELIIRFKANKSSNSHAVALQKFDNPKIDSLNRKHNIQSVKLTGNKKQKDTYILKFNSQSTVKELIESYNKTGLFEYVEPNYIGSGHGAKATPNDMNYNRQWAHENNGTFNLTNSTEDADMDTDLAWDVTKGDANLIVAILDSGTKLDHPEFAGRIWTNSDETEDGTDTDGNNYTDDFNGGWDFANNDNDPTDDHGHGTNVAGIALASGNNEIGYAGVNWNSKIMVCKVLDNANNGLYSWWAEAIYYAVDNGASVINLSAGGNGSSTLLKDAIDYAFDNNVSVVVSSGNQNSVIQYPAKYSNAIAVGATNPDDTRSVPFFWSQTSGSNFGSELDFVAPGNYIYGLNYQSNTNYNGYWGGTSQAAPQVAGIISLMLSIDSSLTVNDIRYILEQTSEDQVGNSNDVDGWDQYYGHGRVNAYKALTHQILNSKLLDKDYKNVGIYPNPALSGNEIKITNLPIGEHLIDLYNTNGKRVSSINYAIDQSASISLPPLQTGIYILKISTKSHDHSITKKIIIN